MPGKPQQHSIIPQNYYEPSNCQYPSRKETSYSKAQPCFRHNGRKKRGWRPEPGVRIAAGHMVALLSLSDVCQSHISGDCDFFFVQLH